MTSLLEVKDLTKVFSVRGADADDRNVVALDRISFTMEAGSSLALVGESGSGKSTAARVIAGLETATSGSVTIDGRVRSSTPQTGKERRAFARHVQMVFQDPNSSLNPRQRVHDGLAEVLGVHFNLSKSERAERVATLLQQVGLEPSQGAAYPRHLSGGQRQRVSIARALALEPRLVILDEAVSALDVSVQAQVINLLNDLRDQTGVTYLFISHDLGLVRHVTDQTIVLHHGQIVEHGMTEDVLSDPQEEYTKRLLAAVPKPGWRPRRRDERAMAPELHPEEITDARAALDRPPRRRSAEVSRGRTTAEATLLP